MGSSAEAVICDAVFLAFLGNGNGERKKERTRHGMAEKGRTLGEVTRKVGSEGRGGGGRGFRKTGRLFLRIFGGTY